MKSQLAHPWNHIIPSQCYHPRQSLMPIFNLQLLGYPIYLILIQSKKKRLYSHWHDGLNDQRIYFRFVHERSHNARRPPTTTARRHLMPCLWNVKRILQFLRIFYNWHVYAELLNLVSVWTILLEKNLWTTCLLLCIWIKNSLLKERRL